MALTLNFPEKIGGHKKQEKVWQSTARFIDIMAGRRGGKDWIGTRKAIQYIYRDLADGKGIPDEKVNFKRNVPKLEYWFLAPTYTIIKEVMQHIFMFLPEELIQDDKSRSNPPKIWLKPNILIHFKSGDNPQSLVGSGLNGCYITETARLKKAVWNDNLRPTLSDKQGWAIMTTTPLPNWYMEDIRPLSQQGEKKDVNWEGHFWTTAENTTNPDLISEVENARRTMPERYFKRNYLACGDAFQGQILDSYDRSIHVKKIEYKKDKYKYVFAGVDWGYTHNGCICVIGITKDDNIHVLEEIAKPRIPVVSQDPSAITWVSLAKQILNKYHIEMFFLAPDEPEHIDQFKRSGVYPCRKADNAVSAGIQYLSTFFNIDENNHTRITINTTCKDLIREIPKYRWKENKEEIQAEEPIKENDDSIDALRYASFSSRKYLKSTF